MKLEKIIDTTRLDAGRFDLRPVQSSDAGLIAHYAGDARVACMTPAIPHPLPPGWAEAQVARVMGPDEPEDIWVMDGTRTGGAEVMGLLSLKRMDRDQSEIAYWVAPAFWNGGVASAAIETILAANPQQARTVFACVFQDNAASARVLTNCGFAYLGDAECYSVARGANVPTWTYSHAVGMRQ